jgi:hypothetical protein
MSESNGRGPATAVLRWSAIRMVAGMKHLTTHWQSAPRTRALAFAPAKGAPVPATPARSGPAVRLY